MSGKREHVAGFLINPDTTEVALISKKRPAGDPARLDAIGAEMESGERPEDAMRRTFRAHTGVDLHGWEHFATLNDHAGAVYFYRHFDTSGALSRVTTTTDEHVVVREASHPSQRLLPAITWLIPLAFYRHRDFDPVVFTERANSMTRMGGQS